MARSRARHLVPLLLVTTVVTGVVDAVSYLALGRVFVANMTGNVVFVGFAWAGDTSLSARESLLALLCFLLGAVGGGRIASWQAGHRGRLLAAGSAACFTLLAAALIIAVLFGSPYAGSSRTALVILLALAMGTQSATARALGVADVTTVVLTMTLTSLVAELRPGIRANRPALRRAGSVLSMLAGALAGALLVLRVDSIWALGTAAAVTFVVVVLTLVLARGTTGVDWELTT